MFAAVIPAAGRGTRLGDLTSGCPKPMLPLSDGRPILEHVLDSLRSAGCARALIVTGYRAEMIEEHFHGHPLKLEYRRQQTLDGTARAALLAEEFTRGEPFLFTFGDILTSSSTYRGMFNRMDPDCEAAAGVRWVEDPCQGAAVYERDGVITGIVEKPPRGRSTTNWNSAGLYVFRASIFDELRRVPLSPRGEYEITSAVSQLIDRGKRLLIYPVEGEWRDIGRPEDLQSARGEGGSSSR